MMHILLLVPWLLTVVMLLVIMVQNKNIDNYEDEQEYDEDEEGFGIVRVAVYGENAYWVHNNVFYQSEIIVEPDFTTAKPIDTMSLTPKEVKRLLGILDELEQSERE